MNKNTVRGLKATAIIAGIGLLAGCSASGNQAVDIDLGSGPAVAGEVKQDALDGVTLTFVSWGGVFQDAQNAAMESFEADSGVRLLSDGPTEYSKVKAQVDSANVNWDVVDADIVWAAAQCGEDGLFMDLDLSIVDISNIQNQELVGDCFVPAMQYGSLFVYNTDKYDDEPQGWQDFFDVEKYPGKRAINGEPGDVGPGIIEAALLADGVKPEDLYPLDAERALAKLDTIRDHLIFWTTGAESQQMVESGEADMVHIWSGRAYGAIENGAPYAPVWNQAFVVNDAIGVPKGVKNPKASMAWLNYYLGAKAQEIMAEESSYSPIHADAKPNFSENAKKFDVARPEIAEQMVTTDPQWWADNFDEQAELWANWLQQG
ncbi:ABC transporter substrate-binding protein [Leucobacter chinensis]|uniref:ABC transporter substrate-binding protein n=1 Tax=Leucobacter chinensis TaxID=2851010 RepID=UPI001C233B25|nr:ABC transporter substrate-binding protein [Leucobacter chinensis]